jgi:hypothetical protein
MPENPSSFILGLNVPPAVPPGAEAQATIGFDSTASGPALLVSIVGAPIVVNVNLDLADDEVAIGGPDAGATRRLFLGVFDGASNNILAVTTVAGNPVVVSDGGGSVTVDGTVAVGPTVTPGTGAANLGKAEDAVAGDGDTGVMALGVRRDADGPTAADGDYTELQTDANGRLKVDGGGTGGGVHAEDSVAAGGANGVFSLAVRRDTPAASAGDGDYIEQQVNEDGFLRTVELGGEAFNASDVNVPSGPAVSLRAALANRIAITIFNRGPGPLEVALTAAAFNTTGIRIPRGQHIKIRNYRGEVFGVSNTVGTRAKVMEEVE